MNSIRVPTEKTIVDPQVTITIDVASSTETVIVFSERCSNCSGYGSPCRACTSGRIERRVDPTRLKEEIGPWGRTTVLSKLLNLVELIQEG